MRGLIAGPCPSGDAKTVATIAKADAAKATKICRACGGGDAACGGADDLTPDTIGFTPTCPPLGIGTSCGGVVTTLSDLLACATCITEFKTDCLDALAVPGEKPYPNACAVQPTPTPTATATPTLTPTPTPTFTPPAGPAAIACERAIVKEAGGLARTRAQALAKCEADKQAGKVPLAADCLTATKAGPKIAKAEQRLAERVGKACGGANKTCNSADIGPDADASLPEIGWGALLCPGFEDTHCVAPIVDCADVAGCITCVHAAAVDQAIALAFAPAVPDEPEHAGRRLSAGDRSRDHDSSPRALEGAAEVRRRFAQGRNARDVSRREGEHGVREGREQISRDDVQGRAAAPIVSAAAATTSRPRPSASRRAVRASAGRAAAASVRSRASRTSRSAWGA